MWMKATYVHKVVAARRHCSGEGEGGWKDCRGQRDILINQMCKSHGTNRDSLIGNNYRGEEYKKKKKNRLCRVNWIVQIFVRFVGHVKTRTRLPLICEMKSWVLNHLSCFSITRCCSPSLSFALFCSVSFRKNDRGTRRNDAAKWNWQESRACSECQMSCDIDTATG